MRVTRGELESLVRPTVGETVTALERAVRSAGLEAGAVDHVLLVGGSSRIPLVSELVSSGLGRPVAVDAHPKHAVAMGAAIVAARTAHVLRPGPSLRPGPRLPPPPSTRPAPPSARPAPPSTPPIAPPSAPIDPRPAPPTTPPPTARPTGPPPAAAPPPPPPAASPRPAPPTPVAAAPAAAPGGYRSGATPPPLGSSNDLPPGYLTDDAKAERRRSQNRRRALSVVGGVVALAVGLLVTLAITQRANEPTTLVDLESGDCFNGEDLNDISPVDCAERHGAQLYAVVGAADPAADFAADAVQSAADTGCRSRFDPFYGAGKTVAAENGLGIQAIAPTGAQWDEGQTDSYCLVQAIDGNALQGSMAGKGAT